MNLSLTRLLYHTLSAQIQRKLSACQEYLSPFSHDVSYILSYQFTPSSGCYTYCTGYDNYLANLIGSSSSYSIIMSSWRDSSPPRIHLPEHLYKIDHWEKNYVADWQQPAPAYSRPTLSHRSSSSTLQSRAESTVSTLVGSTRALIEDGPKKQIPNLGMPVLDGWPLALTMFS